MSDAKFRRTALAIVDAVRTRLSDNVLEADFADKEGLVSEIELTFEENFRSARLVTPFRIPRLPWDAHFMLEAHLAATRSTCDRGPALLLDPGRHGVGAVFVRDRRVIAGGYNGSPPGEPHCCRFECPECEWEAEVSGPETVTKDCPECGGNLEGGHLMRDRHCIRTLHAEENAILQCAMDGTSPKGATVYTTAGPCWDCVKRFLRVGIARVVYGAEYESRHEMSGRALTLLARRGIQVDRLDVRDHLPRDD